MAAVVHGCGSPRRHHGSANACHAQHQPHSANVYGTAMKYPRSPLSPSGHLHHYGGENAYTQSAQYAAQTLPQQAYLPQTNISMQQQQQQQQLQHQQQQQQSYAQSGGNRPSSAGPSLSLCSNYWNHPHAAPMLYRSGRHHQKQKSAVELLAETKPFYVKSDAMMQRFQDASYRSSSAAVAAAATANKRRVSMTNCNKDEKYNLSYDDLGQSIDMDHRYATATGYRLQNPPTHMGRRSVVASSSGNMLQNKLRTLLSAEGRQQSAGHYRQQLDYCGMRQTNVSELSGHDDDDNVPNVLPPLLYGSTSLNVDCSLNLEQNNEDEPLVLTENYRPISPPAEYAAQKLTKGNDNRYRFNYHRSYSHSHETAAEKLYQSTEDYNMDSHKSLPDLHSQTSRHSPHSEILSCCSRGNRSIKSAGESSLNRDSGGSSGHYTGSKSEPCYRQRDGMRLSIKNKNCCSTAVRRDSGSSTQHSGNSFYGQASPSMPQPTDYIGCTCKQPTSLEPNDFFFNFATPEVPEEFQDDYTPPVSTLKGLHRGSSSSSHQYTSLNCSGSTNYSYNSGLARSPDSAPSIDDAITPPPMQFKRQKCIRFKNRNRPVQYHHSSSHSGSINEAVEQCMAQEQRVAQEQRMEQQRDRTDQLRERAEHQRERAEHQRERAEQQRQQHKQQQQQQQREHQQQQQRHQSYALPKCYASEQYENVEKQQQQQQQQQQQMELKSSANAAAAAASALHYEEAAASRSRSNSIQELERFFDRLGLNDEKFHEIYNLSRRRGSNGSDNSGNSSTVFFSDVSTVDSMRLPDSTETQPQTTQTYRPSEPPSIVERNARIIKWLCNCRKMQYA